ncbi:MAG TPA: hypothetical protein VNZ86_16595 [Bacteroidia bacterium]|nr:hypothetical protein [Bacteroidia bacterium]
MTMRSAFRLPFLLLFFALFGLGLEGSGHSFPATSSSAHTFILGKAGIYRITSASSILQQEITAFTQDPNFHYKYKKKKGFRRLIQHSPGMYTLESSLGPNYSASISYLSSCSIPLYNTSCRDLIRGPPALS